MKHLIIGNGIAGISTAETIRKNRPADEIVLISDENEPPYMRANLSRYVMNLIPIEKMRLKDDDWFHQNSIEQISGRAIRILSKERKIVYLKDEQEQTASFDRLCIAAGAKPNRLKIPGHGLSGVTVYRSLEDADRIKEQLGRARRMAVIGGGVLGMEAAEIAVRHKLPCAVLQRGFIGKPLLDKKTSEILMRRITGEDGVHEKGVQVILDDAPQEFIGENGKLKAIRLASGREWPCDMVVLCIGVSADAALFEDSGLEFDRCLIVNERQQTNLPDIYGAGDCAAHPDENGRLTPTRTWSVSRIQGKTAGLNMCDIPHKMFDDGPIQNASHLFDIPYAVIGEFNASGENHDIISSRPDEFSYRKIVFRDHRVVGALLMGDRRGKKEMLQLTTNKIKITSDADKKNLLDPAFDFKGMV